MTLWDGGCRVTGKSSSFSEPQTESKVEEIKPTKKRFVPTRPRSNYNPPQETRSQKTTLQEGRLMNLHRFNLPTVHSFSHHIICHKRIEVFLTCPLFKTQYL